MSVTLCIKCLVIVDESIEILWKWPDHVAWLMILQLVVSVY